MAPAELENLVSFHFTASLQALSSKSNSRQSSHCHFHSNLSQRNYQLTLAQLNSCEEWHTPPQPEGFKLRASASPKSATTTRLWNSMNEMSPSCCLWAPVRAGVKQPNKPETPEPLSRKSGWWVSFWPLLQEFSLFLLTTKHIKSLQDRIQISVLP